MSDSDLPPDEPAREDIRRIVASSSLGRQLRAARAKQRIAAGEPAPARPARRSRRAGGALPDPASLSRRIDALFEQRGWKVFDFQRAVWRI
jgi:ATP-dependent Lhr-like helicase